jgi:glycyl-tRNA synthetase beta chain
MSKNDFLLELGVEEIPSGYLNDAISSLRDHISQTLSKSRLAFDGIRAFSTPRRLAVLVSGLDTRQPDATFERVGPAKRAAFTADNEPMPALNGFLRSCGATLEDAVVESTPKGEYVVVRRPLPGKDTSELLPSIVTDAISFLTFPKSMHWKDADFHFARPMRWIVALFGEDIIPVEFHGVVAGRVSRGNRFPGLDTTVEISSPEQYEAALDTVKVIADSEKRKERIRYQLDTIFPDHDARVIPDENLLETVTNLVEYPTAVVADFDPKYLALPEKVITSTLSANQRVFGVQDAGGKLSNRFVFISNGNPEYSSVIRSGNEKVVRPRLEDAVFFLQEDLKTPLEGLLPAVAEVTFQAKLGSLREKTDRIVALTRVIGEALKLDDETLVRAERGALLCKTDLVTHMIGEKEFTKLQGYIGMEYAIRQGEHPDVAAALFEHYLPRGQNDALPSTTTGRLVALADKIDTVCGIIGVGMVPTGSADPFALRRAANGIVQILLDGDLDIDLNEIIDSALGYLHPKIGTNPETRKILGDFFRQRVVWLLKEQKIDYDVVECVMHISYGQIPDLTRRARAVQEYKSHADFLRLVLGFKRVSNILAQAGSAGTEVDWNLLESETERALFGGTLALEKRIDDLLISRDYTAVLTELVHFSILIDRFFEDVLVNAEDSAIRGNRLSMLNRIRAAFLKVADLSLIVTETA